MSKKVLPIDQGYGWVIVIAASSTFLLAAGGYKIQGVLMVEVFERFERVYSPSTLLWVFTIPSIGGSIFSPLIGYLIVKFGHRTVSMAGVLALCISQVGLAYAWNLPTLIILHSVPAGFGYDGVIISAMLVSRQYFRKRKALAIGLIAGGSGLGTFILPNIIRLLFEHMDFSGALLLYAGINLQFLVFSALLRPISYYEQVYKSPPITRLKGESLLLSDSEFQVTETRIRSCTFSHQQSDENCTHNTRPYHSTSQLDNTVGKEMASSLDVLSVNGVTTATENGVVKEKVNWRVLLMPKFIMLCISIMVFSLANAVVYNCVPALGKEGGVPKEQVALAMALAGFIEIPCRIGNGFLADRKFISATAQYSFCIFGAGFLTLLTTLVQGLPGVVLALVGMSSMGISVFNLLPLVLKELIGEENVTNGMSIQNSTHIIPFIISSFITGAIYNSTESWRYVFFYIAGTLMLASMTIWPYLLMKRFSRNHQ